MGFFKNLSADISQAVGELIPKDMLDADKDEIEVNTLDVETDTKNIVESLENSTDNLTESEKQIISDFLNEDFDNIPTGEDVSDDTKLANDGISEEKTKELEEVDIALADEENDEHFEYAGEKISLDTTIVTEGTVIGGGIVSSGSIEVYGEVQGDVECDGTLTVLGSVTGSVRAGQAYICTSRFDGDIICEGNVNIAQGTVVVGNIYGSSATIAGAVKGEIDIKGPVIIDSTAVVKGNVKGRTVQVNNGAVLHGFCSQDYSEIDIDEIF